MKKKLKIFIITLLLITGITFVVKAVPCFGNVNYFSTSWSEGDCAYTKNCYKQYILWIMVNDHCETTRVCLGETL